MKIELNLDIELSGSQIWALAEFLKRVGRENLVDYAVDEEEAILMSNSLEVLRDSLARHGYEAR